MACGVETAASDTPLACTHLSLSLSFCRYFLRLSLSLSLLMPAPSSAFSPLSEQHRHRYT